LPVSIGELNRVLGGGLVPGSLVLLGGDPGIGKSTLLLQAAEALAMRAGSAMYVAAEESAEQVRLRADRLGLEGHRLYVVAETCLDAVLEEAEQLRPAVLVVDSIQTVYLEALESSPGSVSQVRECTMRLMQYAKRSRVPVFIVGHVTKEGVIAGPRVVEHMVDAVLYLEGERFQQYRILRAVKNRFGSIEEVGVFEMSEGGLREIRNPSEVFVGERAQGAPGSAVVVTLEGTRPILVEVQALTSPAGYSMPRRTVTGFDVNRLQMLLAVLAKRAGVRLSDHDVFVNIAGGLRVVEPAADLGVALAVVSSARDVPVDVYTVLIGEVGLSGELRGVSGLERRLQEAARLGFHRAVVPLRRTKDSVMPSPMDIVRVRTLAEAIEQALSGRWPASGQVSGRGRG
jgi:DNA repair protein RadA/Sms